MPIASIAGGLIGQAGSQAGGNMAWGAANQAAQMQQQEAERGRRALSPWTSAGEGALNKITKMLGLGELTQEGNNYGQTWLKADNAKALQEQERNAFTTSPGYTFRLDEGIKARDRSAGARGMRLSGAQQKAIDTYGQNVASEEYTNYFNQLSALSGGGQAATSNANSTSAGLVSGAAGNIYAGGAARGSAYERGSNALATGVSKGFQNAFTLYDYFR